MQSSRFDQAAKQAASQTTPTKANGEQTSCTPSATSIAGAACHLYSGQSGTMYRDLSFGQDASELVKSMPANHGNRPYFEEYGPWCSQLTSGHSTHTKPNFFWDTPWGAVPSDRVANLVPPVLPRGRLLGGSSKSSKLAALVAARKKKEEASHATTSTDEQTDRAVSLLNRLGQQKESIDAKVTSQAAPSSPTAVKSTPKKVFPIRKKPTESVDSNAERPTSPPKDDSALQKEQTQSPRGPPSMFAQAIFGSDISADDPDHKPQPVTPSGQDRDAMFSLPFAISEARNPFAEPSPDDIVLSAQSKGSLSALKRLSTAD